MSRISLPPGWRWSRKRRSTAIAAVASVTSWNEPSGRMIAAKRLSYAKPSKVWRLRLIERPRLRHASLQWPSISSEASKPSISMPASISGTKMRPLPTAGSSTAPRHASRRCR